MTVFTPAYRFRLVFLLLVFFMPTWRLALRAQPTPIGGIINRYAAVSAIDTCSGALAVSDTAGFRPGAAALLIQMQGADIFTGNSLLYGSVQSMNFAGRYERTVIDSVTAGTVYVRHRLLYGYALDGRVQLVTFPQYADAVLTDTIFAQPWNGTTGGVIALDVSGTLTLNAPISADGAGYRGGAAYVGPNNNCNWLIPETDYYYGLGNWRGAPKGEGIAAFSPGRELGRGPQGNGGGGANDHNAGGGGGANSVPGGNGGNNDEPSTFGCDGYYPGLGGRGVPFTANRVFMGGGGGAGHANNTLFSAGGHGGGIIVVRAGAINGFNPVVTANGQTAKVAQGDGAGGGGAGGTIWIQADTAAGNLEIQANGGRGGNSFNNNDDRCLGPGGGGSGGRILSNIPGVVLPPGGPPGIITGSTAGCANSSSGAQSGSEGLVEPLPASFPQGTFPYSLPQILAAPASDTVCAGQAAVFTVLANAGGWNYQWQLDAGAGWQNLTDPAAYPGLDSSTLTVPGVGLAQTGVQFRVLVQRPGCYETASAPAALTVSNGAAAAFTAVPTGLGVNFTNQSANASAYYWDFGDGQSATSAGPQHTYAAAGTYTVTLYAISPCDTAVAVQTVTVLAAPVAGFTVPAVPAGCDSVSVAFTNTSSAATAFVWTFPGGTPAASSAANPSVTYSTSGTYVAVLVASNAAGSDTVSQTLTVTVGTAPVAAFSAAVNGNTVQFSNQSAGATTYGWNFGDNTTATEASPAHTYAQSGTYTVTLTAIGPCGVSTATQTVTTLLPPIAAFFVPDTVAGCETTGAVLTVANTTAGTASFSWTFSGGATPPTSTQASPTVVLPVAGTYTATLIATNAAGADTVTQPFFVQLYGAPSADFDYTIQGDGTVTFTNLGAAPALGYTWDFGDGSPLVNTSDATHQYAQSGVYTVTLVAANPCGAAVYQDNVTVILVGTDEAADATVVRLYPNPTAGRVVVDCGKLGNRPEEVRIFNAAGQVCRAIATVGLEKFELDLSLLPAGIYQIWMRFGAFGVTRLVIKN